ncbi:hypothetical protein [Klebsiella variicola]|uniref:hypothetical protein n=1 Tax=Klebsiella variicola TaxID=244366 RepID=UPI002567F289|nr:hypothetical protein [Klebsiella variicola]MDL3989287.1 hypothetical protein [Klebsiella variicola]
MTDITELAQKPTRYGTNSEGVFTNQTYGAYVSYLDYVALVEELEKAQTKADVYDMLRDDYGLREKGVGLADFVDWQAKRIAELESRTVTVKLTDINDYLAEVHDKTLNRAFRLLAEGVRAGDVAAMRATGIKVEAE